MEIFIKKIILKIGLKTGLPKSKEWTLHEKGSFSLMENFIFCALSKNPIYRMFMPNECVVRVKKISRP